MSIIEKIRAPWRAQGAIATALRAIANRIDPQRLVTTPLPDTTFRNGTSTCRIGRYGVVHDHATMVLAPRDGRRRGELWTVRTAQSLTYSTGGRTWSIDMAYAEFTEIVVWNGAGWRCVPYTMTVTWQMPGRPPKTDVLRTLRITDARMKSRRGGIVMVTLTGTFGQIDVSQVPESDMSHLRHDAAEMMLAALAQTAPDGSMSVYDLSCVTSLRTDRTPPRYEDVRHVADELVSAGKARVVRDGPMPDGLRYALAT